MIEIEEVDLGDEDRSWMVYVVWSDGKQIETFEKRENAVKFMETRLDAITMYGWQQLVTGDSIDSRVERLDRDRGWEAATGVGDTKWNDAFLLMRRKIPLPDDHELIPLDDKIEEGYLVYDRTQGAIRPGCPPDWHIGMTPRDAVQKQSHISAFFRPIKNEVEIAPELEPPAYLLEFANRLWDLQTPNNTRKEWLEFAAREIAKLLPKEEPWILLSERLPDVWPIEATDGECVVSANKGYSSSDSGMTKGWPYISGWNQEREKKLILWKPLKLSTPPAKARSEIQFEKWRAERGDGVEIAGVSHDLLFDCWTAAKSDSLESNARS